jgi:hypothetical protein
MRMLIAMAGLAALAACAHYQPSRVGPDPYHVDVVVDANGKITKPVDKLQPKDLGRAVTWTVKNESANEVTVMITYFRATKFWEKRDEKEKRPREDPLACDCVRKVTVAPRGSGDVICKIKANTWRPRTYKYDIVGLHPGKEDVVLLDPEMEIP